MDAALDPRAARLLHMLRAGEAEGAAAASPLARRETLRALADLAADPGPPDVYCEDLSCPASDGARLTLRRYTPEDGLDGCALLYLHGGGWVAGDLETHHGVCGALAKASSCTVFALDYRRPPEHAFPGPMRDALDALAWLAEGGAGERFDRLALGGDSAGGNLAAAVAQARNAPWLALLLLLCPILDLPRTGGSRTRFGQGYFISAERLAADTADHLQGADPADGVASPLRADRLPRAARTLIHAAECDPFRDEALVYAERLQAAGLKAQASVHPGMIHYFYALPRAIPAARTLLAGIGAQVRVALEQG